MWSESIELDEEGRGKIDISNHFRKKEEIQEYLQEIPWEISLQAIHVIQRKIGRNPLPSLGFGVEVLCSHSYHKHLENNRYNSLGVFDLDLIPEGYQMVQPPNKKRRRHVSGATGLLQYGNRDWFPFHANLSNVVDVWIAKPQNPASSRGSHQNFERFVNKIVVTLWILLRENSNSLFV